MRNTRALSSFVNLSAKLKQFAAEQDVIVWREFTKGCVSSKLLDIQREHLDVAGGRMGITRWTKCFIMQLLEIT